MSYQRRMEELTKPQSLELLGSVQVGRVAFVHHALPAIRPVNHLLDGDTIIIRATAGAAITELVGSHRRITVAYEADAMDIARQLGWSVIVVGDACVITDQHVAARYRARLEPWVAGSADEVISISTDMVHGYRLVPSDLFDESGTPVRLGRHP